MATVGLDLERLFEASPNPYMVLDRALCYVAANRAYLEVTGSDLASILGKNLFEAFPNDPNDPNNEPRRLLERSLEKVLATGQRDVLAYLPYRVAPAPGAEPELRIWSATHVPLLDANGEVELILQHTQDVTNLHRASTEAAHILDRAAALQRGQAELDERLASLLAIIAQSPGFMAFLRGPEHVFELTNPAYDALIGRHGVVGKRVRDALPELIDQGFYELLDDVFRTGEPFFGRDMRVRLMREDGREAEVFLDFVYQPIHAERGEIIGVLATGHDVTERHRSLDRQRFVMRAGEILAQAPDDALAALKALAWAATQSIADFAAIDVFEDDASRRIVFAHADPEHAAIAAALESYAIPQRPPPTHALDPLNVRPQVISNVTDEILVGSTQDEDHLELMRTVAPKSVLVIPIAHRGRPFGALILITAQSERRYDEADLPAMAQLGRLAAAAIDNARLYSEREQLLRREHDARQRAEAASRAKDEFIAMLGHELRNPLAPILAATQLVRERGDTSAEREIGIIERQTHHLVRIVDDLLDVSRIVHGKVELRRAPIEIASIATPAIEMVAAALAKKRQTLDVDVPAHGLVVDGDEARLVQVLANLLSNASRYTNEGGHVWLTAERDGGEVVVSVRDDGVGIAPEILPTMFDMFVQAPQTPERSRGGLGLGLTLVRGLVELHGGTAVATSDGEGQGSELTLRLPRVEGKDVHIAAASSNPTKRERRRVMIVDDNVDAAELIAEYLTVHGHTVELAHDGLTALDRIVASPPDVAVVDIGLPGLDGYALAERVRATLGARAPRLLALTGYGTEADRARALAAGFAAHVTKPVTPAKLLELIDGGL